MPSPTISTFHHHQPVCVTLDSGANATTISRSLVTRLQINMTPTVHQPSQADGKTRLTPLGEVTFSINRGSLTFLVEAVVVEELDCEFLAGMPFLHKNGITLDIPRGRAVVRGQHIIPFSKNPSGFSRTTPLLLRSPQRCIIHSNNI